MKDFDVVVVGAGLAGLHTARRLAESGARVLLADRKPTLTYAIHTTGIFVRRTLEDFDLPEDCLGPVIRHVSLYSPRRRALDLESPQAEFRIGRMGRLYSELLNRCRAAGAQVLLESSYAGCEPQHGAVTVRLQTRKRDWPVKTRFLIGADGANSRVASDLGLSVNRRWLVGVEAIYRHVPLNGPPRLHCFLDRRLAPGYIGWAAHDGDEVHLGVAGDAALFQPLPALKAFRDVAGRFVDLSAARFAEQRGGRIPVGGVLPRIASEHGLLVGDAAGAVSPLTAGGLDPCLRLSDVAADVVTRYLGGGGLSALEAYDGRLFRREFRTRLLLRGLLGACRSDWLLECGCAALRQPVLRRVAEGVFFGKGSFPRVRDAARTTPLELTSAVPT
jgi:flavin-dependent dehydrogenase